ncbi:MAG TPA: diaminopimelate epimerase [Pseudonocardiaceae bacterium]
MTREVRFVKGHGTQNDFVLLPDPDGALDLTEARVRALCDRQRGLGADGVLRVVRAANTGLPGAHSVEWFMDYRNADGSIAEMCGNGVRVFARYLVDNGLAKPGEFAVGTRAGVRPVTVHDDGTVTVEMGPARILGRSVAAVSGHQIPGVAVDVGNPHLACVLDALGGLDALDLGKAPGHDAALFPRGVNVEFIDPVEPGRVRMRVHERGVGETRSCGTGTVAAVAAVLYLAGRDSGESIVDVPGGRVRVTIAPGESTLTGPAVFVASGEIDAQWWARTGE